MYKNIKSRIKTSYGTSAFFSCNVGVRQGENLSPFLFSIYLNDLEQYFHHNNVTGLDCEFAKDELYMFMKIFILLYADDTVILATLRRICNKHWMCLKSIVTHGNLKLMF